MRHCNCLIQAKLLIFLLNDCYYFWVKPGKPEAYFVTKHLVSFVFALFDHFLRFDINYEYGVLKFTATTKISTRPTFRPDEYLFIIP